MIALVRTASHFPPIWPVCPLSTGLLIAFLPSLTSFFLLGCQAVTGKKGEAWTRLLLSVICQCPVPLLSPPSMAHPGEEPSHPLLIFLGDTLGIAHIPISAQETVVPSVPDRAKDVTEFRRN